MKEPNSKSKVKTGNLNPSLSSSHIPAKVAIPIVTNICRPKPEYL